MAHGALGLLGGDVVGDAGFLAGGAEAGVELGEQRRVAGDVARIEQRGADRGVLGAFDQAILDRARGVADLHAEIPQEVEHVLDDLQRLPRRLGRGQEQQVDVAERRQHAAAVAAGAGDRQMFGLAEAGVRRGVLVERGDQPVDQLAEQARGLQAGDLLLLEGVLHVLLDAREMAAERAERGVARRSGRRPRPARQAPRSGRRSRLRAASAG